MPATGLSSDTIGNPYASPKQTTTYYLYHNKYIETIDSVTVYVENCGISFPDAFTPNNDGVNDYFKPKNSDYKEISGKIFNRWWRELFTFAKPDDKWDGKYKGNYVSEGVCFYLVSVTFANGEVQEKHGSVQLIR